MKAKLQSNGRQISFMWTKGERLFDVKPYLKGTAKVTPIFSTPCGALFVDDCMAVLPQITDEIVDTAFADPPFNLGKEYGENTDDQQPDDTYLDWCRSLGRGVCPHPETGWLALSLQSAEVEYPTWGTLDHARMDFRHWIAIEMSACLPILGRMHPSDYSLLYYSRASPTPLSNPHARAGVPPLRRRSQRLRWTSGCFESKWDYFERCVG